MQDGKVFTSIKEGRVDNLFQENFFYERIEIGFQRLVHRSSFVVVFFSKSQYTTFYFFLDDGLIAMENYCQKKCEPE